MVDLRGLRLLRHRPDPRAPGARPPRERPLPGLPHAGLLDQPRRGAPGFWPKICALLGVPELVDDPRFRTPGDRVRHRKELEALLQPHFEKETTATWLARLEAEGVPADPILTYDQVFADPQVEHREMAMLVDHPVAGRTWVLGIPIKLSRTPGAIRRPAPTLGQHTDEVLGELGYDAEVRSGRRGSSDPPRTRSSLSRLSVERERPLEPPGRAGRSPCSSSARAPVKQGGAAG